jgi:pSer/pThr/pTyr-binding forkhead associated (FHA) protein
MQNSLTAADEYYDELLQSVNDSIPENKEQWLELIDANPYLTDDAKAYLRSQFIPEED